MRIQLTGNSTVTLMRRASHLLFMLSVFALTVVANAQDWPREIKQGKYEITLYQPQLESFDHNRLAARAAVSVKRTSTAEPVFGAIWIEARVETDRDKRVVSILNAKVTRTRFPEAGDTEEKSLARAIEAEVPGWDIEISLDRLLAGLEVVKDEQEASKDMKMDPPMIIFVDHPAVLVPFDGPPKLQAVQGRPLMRVVNSPFLIVLQTATKTYYLDGGQIWYKASDPTGPWSETKTPPQDVRNLRQDLGLDEVESAAKEDQDPRVPRIVTATEATELIVTDGKIEYTPIKGTDLLYVSNSDSDVFMEIGSQQNFIVLSGRWYSSKGLDGPWSFVASDALPKSFSQIPQESEKGHVSTFVAGTRMAHEAVLDSQIPQTSAVKRSATITVQYDGPAKFMSISGTKLQYAINSQFAVIQADGTYYCCHEAVWYQAKAASGPWTVSIAIPSEIHSIPPSCPIYYVKYVYIYEVMPEVIYVGYTPGYTCSYVYNTTIIYGTGWYYRPWYGRYYYARPCTYGYYARYNPYYGWRCGFSFSNGRVTVAYGRGAWWGPARYNRYRRGYSHGYNRGYAAGYARGRHNANIYNRSHNRNQHLAHNRPVRAKTTISSKRSSRPVSRKNDVFADRYGNVHRRTDKGWEKRKGQQWSSSQAAKARSAERAAKPVRPVPVKQPAQQTPSTLNRDYQARQRGTQRTNTYRHGGSGGSVRRSGGGGRRR